MTWILVDETNTEGITVSSQYYRFLRNLVKCDINSMYRCVTVSMMFLTFSHSLNPMWCVCVSFREKISILWFGFALLFLIVLLCAVSLYASCGSLLSMNYQWIGIKYNS